MFTEHEIIVRMRKWMKEPTNRFSRSLPGLFPIVRNRDEPRHYKPKRLRITPRFQRCRTRAGLQHWANILRRHNRTNGQSVRYLSGDTHHLRKNTGEIDRNALSERLHCGNPVHAMDFSLVCYRFAEA